ncbi:hypothetical protein ACFC0D_37765 [Streptomyces sp. NPDC056222]|uniref:hypothetical protein n=1 Tax=Streptomyces sp. NPDC056222 TaxID=3345749 RepID=UPI0035DD9425
MSITSPIPVLQGDKGTELRSADEELMLRRPDDELRIPLTAIARVQAERRAVSIELTAPAGATPTVYRVTDVSAAAASVFADVVNAALPERAEGETVIDGATLVVTRSLIAGEEEDEDDEVRGGLPKPAKWTTYTAFAAVAALAVVVGLLDRNWGRGIATLLLGELGVGASFLAWAGLTSVWEDWYLRRYGITVDARQIYRNGTTTNAYTDTDGVTRYVGGSNKGKPVQVAYHPRKPLTAVVRTGRGDQVGSLILFFVIAAIAALIDYGTFRLALPAFGG